MSTSEQRIGLLERLAEGPVICAEGYLFELERRGYLQAGAFVPEAPAITTMTSWLLLMPRIYVEALGGRLVRFSKPLISGAYMFISYGPITGHRALIGARRKVQSKRSMEPGTSSLLPIAHPVLPVVPSRSLRLRRRLLRGSWLQPRRATAKRAATLRHHNERDGIEPCG